MSVNIAKVDEARHQSTRVHGRGRRRRDRWRHCCQPATHADAATSRRNDSDQARRPLAVRDGRHVQGRQPRHDRSRHRDDRHGDDVCSRARCGGWAELHHQPRTDVLRPYRRTAEIESDPIYQRKAELIKKHDLVVWRFHDHWHMRRPEPMAQGFFRAMGWEQYVQPSSRIITIPETTVGGGGRLTRENDRDQSAARHRRSRDESQ